ncbi:DUF1440 domain-containing protein [Chitinophaga japonensis]|uniref:DUF1440 domain-containing protein n=1 Tax=Chitinophaga japonensis TaxID=104662 RepID=A0A562T6N2_CHIJA|nr:DUF1440 domain-containing protein [Chitinophaga japonensis]TWI89152.1 hypothetical protein LX66_3246 [Chitinophaga japonensis]
MSLSLPGAIARTGLIAGTLDILTAVIVYAVILHKVTAARLLQGIASGVFGRQAFSGGTAMVLTGLLFHYIIAFAFTAGYFLVYPHLPFLKRYPVLNGLLYGILVWMIMNLVVLPLSGFPQAPLRLGPSLLGMAILMVMIGLPVALLAHKHYR